ncbi:MAG: metallophosphoesterase [Akkermansiaceae bacterium]
MVDRRRFIATSALAGSSLAAAGQPERFQFGLMTDCQYADLPDKGRRHFRKSPKKLAEAIAEFNQHPIAFSLHLGDFIERDFSSFEDLAPIAASHKAPLHHLLGNHDFDVAPDRKPLVPAALGLKKDYSAFTANGFRFILLDTTAMGTYRYPKNSPARKKALRELQRLKEKKSPNAAPWNSSLDPVQLVWLEKELQVARTAKQSIIVCGHHPVVPLEAHTLWNHQILIQLFEKYRVSVYLNGHNHRGSYHHKNGTHYLNLHGMVETDRNAFSLATLRPDYLEIKGFGRQKSFELAI